MVLIVLGNAVRRGIDRVTKGSHVVGQSVTMLMVFMISADVVMRYVFNDPIGGVLELTELMMVVLVFLAFGYVELENAQVRVDLLISRLRPRVRLYLEFFNAFIALGIFAIVAWQAIPRSIYLMKQGTITGYLHIPQGPFLLFIAFGCTVLCCQLILKLWRFAAQIRRQE